MQRVVSAAVIGVNNHTQVKYFGLFIGKLAVAPYCMEYGLRRGERFIVLVDIHTLVVVCSALYLIRI